VSTPYREVRAWYERVAAAAPESRDALLDAAGPELRAEVEALLAAGGGADAIAQRVAETAADAAREAVPARIGPWHPLRVLGEGGMGTVLLAERADGEFRQVVALKLIRGFPSDAARERFRRERQVLATLEHPHIARLLDGGTTASGEPYLAMEYVDGTPLPDWIARTAPPLRERVRLFAGLCDAVQYAHQRLVVHRDLKPSNVMVRGDGAPVLLDFGIAKVFEPGDTGEGTVTRAMTPAYASPEQLLGRPVTTATDVFGLGLVLYELLAGGVPERGDAERAATTELPPPSRAAAQSAHAFLRGDAPRLRGDLDRIVRAAVRTEPSARYASAADLAHDVRDWLDGRPLRSAPRHWRYVAGKFVRRHRVGVALGAAALGGLVALSLLLAREGREARAAQARAEREAAAARETTAFLEGLYSELDPNQHAGRALDPVALLDLGRARLDAMTASAPDDKARLQASLATLYANIGKPEQALALARDAHAALAASGAADDRMLEAEMLLRRALGAASQWREAAALGDSIVARARRVGDPIREAEASNGRGLALQTLDQGDRGAADFQRAEALYRAAGDGGRDGLATVLHNRAIGAERGADYPAALALYRESLVLKRGLFGEDHPRTLNSRFAEGKVLIMLGRNDEARALLEDNLARSRRVHGEGTEAVQRDAAELATAEYRLGDYAAAERHYREAIAIVEALYAGRDHVGLSNHLSNLGFLYEDRGDLAAAEDLQRRALEIRRRLFGDASTWAARAQHALARVLLERGALDDAARVLEEALAVRRKELAADHHERVASEALALQLAVARGDLADAQRAAAPLRPSLVRTPPLPPLVRAAGSRALADLALARDDAAAAASLFGAELDARLALYAPAHVAVASARLRLAGALLSAGRREDALAQLVLARPVVESGFVEGAPDRARLAALNATAAPP
jgi:serine/threonine-protein kinase